MTPFTRPKEPAKVAVLIGCAFAVLILIAWTPVTLVSRELASARSAHARVLNTREVLTELQTVLSLLRDAETGERGYVITDDPRFLQPFQSAKVAIDEHLHLLQQALGGQGDKEHLQELIVRSRAQMAFLSQVIELQRNG